MEIFKGIPAIRYEGDGFAAPKAERKHAHERFHADLPARRRAFQAAGARLRMAHHSRGHAGR